MKTKSKLNIFLAYSSICFAFFAHTFAFSAEADTALLTQSNLILKNIEAKLNDIAVDRNSSEAKSHISNQFLLKELQNTNKYILQISGILQDYMRNENQAQARNNEHMKIMEDEVSNLKKLISEKQEKVAMK